MDIQPGCACYVWIPHIRHSVVCIGYKPIHNSTVGNRRYLQARSAGRCGIGSPLACVVCHIFLARICILQFLECICNWRDVVHADAADATYYQVYLHPACRRGPAQDTCHRTWLRYQLIFPCVGSKEWVWRPLRPCCAA